MAAGVLVIVEGGVEVRPDLLPSLLAPLPLTVVLHVALAPPRLPLLPCPVGLSSEAVPTPGLVVGGPLLRDHGARDHDARRNDTGLRHERRRGQSSTYTE